MFGALPFGVLKPDSQPGWKFSITSAFTTLIGCIRRSAISAPWNMRKSNYSKQQCLKSVFVFS